MDTLDNELNIMLTETFRTVLRYEELSLRRSGANLSISEVHLLEAVGRGGEGGRNIGELAAELDITLPSVTVAVNKLSSKGYVEKIRCTADKRVVYARLTPRGVKMDRVHQYFHEQMIRNIAMGFSAHDKEIFLQGIRGINSYFKKKTEAIKENADA